MCKIKTVGKRINLAFDLVGLLKLLVEIINMGLLEVTEFSFLYQLRWLFEMRYTKYDIAEVL